MNTRIHARRVRAAALPLLSLAAASGPAAAQDFNVDLGVNYGAPASTHGAAGQAGVWNEVDMTAGVMTPIPLVDLSGAATAATIEFNKTGNGNFFFNNPLTTGDDHRFMDDLCDVGNAPTSKVKFTFKGLQNGTYDVLVYAWAPDDPLNYITGAEVIGGTNGTVQLCGGADWTGAHVLGETYVTDTVVVTVGELYVRYSQSSGYGNANGIQIALQGGGCSSSASSYCTAGTSALGCQALIGSTGVSSATATTGFDVTASGVEAGQAGLVFYSLGAANPNQWGNGTSWRCFDPPNLGRGTLQTSGGAGPCDGTYSEDLNARWTAKPNHNPGAGAVVRAQYWYRDPQNTSNKTTSFSDALEWTVCP